MLLNQIEVLLIKLAYSCCLAENGWDVVFKRQKTGPLAFNAEYTLHVLRCKKRPLTAEERELVEKAKPIDEVLPRPTAKEQKDFIEKNILGSATEDVPGEVGAPEEADDIPY